MACKNSKRIPRNTSLRPLFEVVSIKIAKTYMDDRGKSNNEAVDLHKLSILMI